MLAYFVLEDQFFWHESILQEHGDAKNFLDR